MTGQLINKQNNFVVCCCLLLLWKSFSRV